MGFVFLYGALRFILNPRGEDKARMSRQNHTRGWWSKRPAVAAFGLRSRGIQNINNQRNTLGSNIRLEMVSIVKPNVLVGFSFRKPITDDYIYTSGIYISF